MRCCPLFALAIAACGSSSPMVDAREAEESMLRAAGESVVIVIAAGARGGELIPIASGSGTIVSSNGAILTNRHVLVDGSGAPHPLFIIARARPSDGSLEFLCAGLPERQRLDGALDLAVLRCDRDLDGTPWSTHSWPALTIGSAETIAQGDRLWVLGFPAGSHPGVHSTSGLVTGWTGERGGARGRAFIKTDAAVTRGDSGGAAINQEGQLIGIPTAFRVRTQSIGPGLTSVDRVGIVRPIDRARQLLDEVGELGSHVSVRGSVADAETGAAIHGASVLLVGEAHSEWARTDEHGVFVTGATLRRGQQYSLSADAPGYMPTSARVGITIDESDPSMRYMARNIALLRGRLHD